MKEMLAAGVFDIQPHSHTPPTSRRSHPASPMPSTATDCTRGRCAEMPSARRAQRDVSPLRRRQRRGHRQLRRRDVTTGAAVTPGGNGFFAYRSTCAAWCTEPLDRHVQGEARHLVPFPTVRARFRWSYLATPALVLAVVGCAQRSRCPRPPPYRRRRPRRAAGRSRSASPTARTSRPATPVRRRSSGGCLAPHDPDYRRELAESRDAAQRGPGTTRRRRTAQRNGQAERAVEAYVQALAHDPATPSRRRCGNSTPALRPGIQRPGAWRPRRERQRRWVRRRPGAGGVAAGRRRRPARPQGLGRGGSAAARPGSGSARPSSTRAATRGGRGARTGAVCLRVHGGAGRRGAAGVEHPGSRRLKAVAEGRRERTPSSGGAAR